jgi:hypothetical protein
MKSIFLLIPAIVAATAAFGAPSDAHSETRDAQAHAAALLSRPHTPRALEAREQTKTTASDAHTSAAALLSGRSDDGHANASPRITLPVAAQAQQDAQVQAAALLSGSRASVRERSRITVKGQLSNEHPVVLIAQQWSTRGIDPNHFILAHPAPLRWTNASAAE